MSTDVAEFPAIDGVDSARGMRSIGANPAVYRRLLRLFCDQHSDDGARLLSLLDAGRRADAARMIHRLRGSSLILGVVGVARQAARIEGHLGVGADALAAAGAGALGESLTSVITAIRRTIPEPMPGAASAERTPQGSRVS
jgi:HPt (histidine-containing phosphotransfer) domain-containing protein